MQSLTRRIQAYQWLIFPANARRRILIHMLFWTCFVLYHLLFFLPSFIQSRPSITLVGVYVIYYLRFIPLYYLLVSLIKTRKRLLSKPPFLLALVLLSLLMMHMITVGMYQLFDLIFGLENLPPIFVSLGAMYLKPLTERSVSDWIVFVYDILELQLLILPIGIKMMKWGFSRSLEQIKWQQERAKTALQSLRSRLNPHFIFNVLNSAVAELQPVSDTGATYLYQASDLIRYTLYDADKEYVPLERELYYIKQLIELESMRAEIRAEISYRFQGTILAVHTVPTLLLLTLVENAFKHSVHSTHLKSFVDISGQVEKNRLVFRISNSIATESVPSENSSVRTGIGLATVRRMLELKYPEDYTFQAGAQEGVFNVLLDVPLNRYMSDPE